MNMEFSFQQQPLVSPELHPIAPTLYRMEGAEDWVRLINTTLAKKETSGKHPNVVVFFIGLPGVGKFANAAGLMADIIEKQKSNDISDMDVGYISFADELEYARQTGKISSPFGSMTPANEQHTVSELMSEHILTWLNKLSNKPKLLIGEVVAVAYPERDQGATPIFAAKKFADSHPETEIFLAGIVGKAVQNQTRRIRRALALIDNPEEANALYEQAHSRLDKPFETQEDIEAFRRSYGPEDAIVATTKLVDQKIRSRRTQSQQARNISLKEYSAYFGMLARDVFDIKALNTLIGTNKLLRRTHVDIPLYRELVKNYSIIPRLPS